MRQRFEIPGRLDGMNEIIDDARACRYKGAKGKRDNQDKVVWAIKAARLKPMECPVLVTVTWVEGMKPGCKRFVPRDKDNIRAGIKFILDGLQEAGIIEDDRFAMVTPCDRYMLNRENPRVIVELEEVDEE